MKNILLLVHDDAGQEARLQAALDIARTFEGHLICLDISAMPVLAGDFYGGVGSVELLAQERATEAANRARLETRLTEEDVPWSMVELTGPRASDLKRAAGLADLIVVNRTIDGFPVSGSGDTAGELVLTCGKPVLAVPHESRGIDIGGRVLVCWDGSGPAHAALRAAVPLLQRARTVGLLQVGDRRVAVSVEEAAAYLSRYDVHAEITYRRDANDVADTILAEAALGHAYVVMGGFNHSRLREALFGGVTHAMLSKSPVPLFLAH